MTRQFYVDTKTCPALACVRLDALHVCLISGSPADTLLAVELRPELRQTLGCAFSDFKMFQITTARDDS